MASFPYLLVLMLCAFHSVTTGIEDFRSFFIIVILLLLVGATFGIISLYFAYSIFRSAMQGQWNTHKLAKINMILKLAQIPSYICIFFIALGCLIIPPGLIIAVMLWILDIMAIVATGFIGLDVVVRRNADEGKTKKLSVIYSILQFIFCLDVIAAIIVLKTRQRN